MSQNPIIKKQTISRTDLGFKIEHNRVGVLYQGQRYVRLLQPGEGPTVSERMSLGDLMVYILDTTPHTLTWRVSLPTQGDRDSFSLTINLKYQVADPRRMVDEQVADTEVLVTRVLEPSLRRVSRQFGLHQHPAADTKLETTVAETDLVTTCGLRRLDPPDVKINLSEDDHRRIKELNDLERARRVTVATTHTAALPTKEPLFKFQTTISLGYRVRKLDELPSDSLEESLQQLWPKLERILRRASQKYMVDQVSEAEVAMQTAIDEALDGGQMEGFGLQIVSAQVSADLDADARQRRLALEDVKHTAALKSVEIEGLQRNMTFYEDLIQKGDWATLAAAAAKGEVSVNDLYQRMNEKQRENLKLRLDLLLKLRADNAKDESQDWQVAQNLLKGIAAEITEAPGPALSPGVTAPQLTDKQETSIPEERNTSQ